MSLEAKLEIIRSPNQQNQQQAAVVLSAVEDILVEQKTEFTPTAYFAALLSLLQQSTSTSAILNKELAAPTVYLLDLVTPFAPVPLLRARFPQILSHLVPVLTYQGVEAPLLRSSIGCLESLLVAQDGASWAIPQRDVGPRRALAGLLGLGLDDRPKVRKRAHEAITKVLGNPPPGANHPAADMCAAIILQSVSDLAKSSESQRRKSGDNDSRLIHALQLVRALTGARGWPGKKIESLCEALLGISKSSNEFLMGAVFAVFEEMFAGMVDGVEAAKLPKAIEVISQLRPSQNDSQLLPSWLAVMARGYEAYTQVSENETLSKLPDLFDSVSVFLASQSNDIRTAAANCLISLITSCIPDKSLSSSAESTAKVFKHISKKVTDLLSVRYQGAWNQVFDILAALLDKLRWRSAPLLNDAVKVVGGLRSNSGFQGKKEAEKVLGQAIRAMGPENVLSILPLNLITPAAGNPGRAWMLPILRDHVENATLAHFKQEFVPLSEALFQKVVDYGEKDKTVEIKIFETLVGQIWALLAGYCNLPLDLAQEFDIPFAELLANILYQKVDLRSDICKSLQQLVDSNKEIIDTPLENGVENLVVQRRVSKRTAKKNIEHIASFSRNLLSVLFNVYSTTPPQSRGFVLECINSILSITPDTELTETFQRIVAMLEDALAKQGKKKPDSSAPGSAKMPSTAHTLMDLIVTITPYLPPSSHQALFVVFSTAVNRGDDPQLQKKAYKVVPRLAGRDPGKKALIEKSGDLQEFLIKAGEKVTPPARKDRLLALSKVVEFLSKEDLHFIPSVLSEVVISTKEVNEKARTAAFDILISMGEKMKRGGTVVNSKVAHMPSDAPNVTATLDEYITMISAGLAGSTPHMISASITALTRILYQFKDDIKREFIDEMVSTLDLFLTSKNREIVGSVLGFIKVCIISLPKDVMLPRFETLLPNLMVWSHEHKAHFKAKVKHIIERMIRRFGYDAVERHVPEEDQKLVVNIRKTRERRKRNKVAAADSGGEKVEKKKQPRFASEFEEAIYGSGTDDGASDSDDEPAVRKKGKRSAKGGETYIHEDEDEPLDLLDRKSMANISSTRPRRTRIGDIKKSQASKTKTNEDGKLLFGGDDDSDVAVEGGDGDIDMEVEDGVNAYVEAISGKDAFKRGQRNRVKFSNKRGRGDDEDEEVEMEDVGDTGARTSARKKSKKEKSGRKGLGVKSVSGGRIAKSVRRKGRR